MTSELSSDSALPVPREDKQNGEGGVSPQEKMGSIRQELQAAEKSLAEQSHAGVPGLVVAHERARMLSAVLVWVLGNGGGEDCGGGLGLRAVGGFGVEGVGAGRGL